MNPARASMNKDQLSILVAGLVDHHLAAVAERIAVEEKRLAALERQVAALEERIMDRAACSTDATHSGTEVKRIPASRNPTPANSK